VKTRVPWLWLVLALTLSALVMPARGHGAQAGGTLSVIVGPSCRANDISLADLRRLFMGYAVTSRAGDKLLPFNHPPKHPTRERFDQLVLNMSPEQMGQYWVAERIRGHLRPPRGVPSEGLLVKVVAKIEGAISYLPTEAVPSGLKVLSVDGRRPGDANYPIAW
jgi:hypothetical protein